MSSLRQGGSCAPDGYRGVSKMAEKQNNVSPETGSNPGVFAIKKRRIEFLEKWCRRCHEFHPLMLKVSHTSTGRVEKRWIMCDVCIPFPYTMVDDLGTEMVYDCNGTDI